MEFLEKLTELGEKTEALALAVRAVLREEAPQATEITYEVMNALALGYSFTGRPADLFMYVAAYKGWVNLGFNEGASLADPARILRGEGIKLRYIRISSLADLERPFVRRFVQQAIVVAKRPVAVDPRTVVKALTERKRKRRV